jgi:hypothetical protein
MITQAYFEDIQPRIIKELYNAKKSIFVAVAWFTDDELYSILCDKTKSGLTVSVLLLNDEINTSGFGLDLEKLKDVSGEIHLIGSKDEMMHNKFCVIDQETVITGSYNWTKKAQSNDENITITKGSKELATDFILEFQRLRKKYIGEGFTIELDVDALVKRLEILEKTIGLKDVDDIEHQTKKLHKLFYDTAVPEDFKVIYQIEENIKEKHYGEAARLISGLLTRYRTVVAWTDPELSGLKLEIHSLEIQISSLEDEKADMEKRIYVFEIRYNRELGELVLKILELQKIKAEEESKSKPEDEETRKKHERAKKDYEEYKGNYEISKKDKLYDLTPEQLDDLKTKYRKITKLTHPDLVDAKFEKQATELFIRAKNAKDCNDLETLNEILEYLEDGKPFPLKHESLTENDILKAEAQRLRNIVLRLRKEINEIKNSKTFKTISEIIDFEDYFHIAKTELLKEFEYLKNNGEKAASKKG